MKIHQSSNKIIDGIRRVHQGNFTRIVLDPNGDNQVCKNKLGTLICEKCGNDVRETRGRACPDSRPDDKWRFL